MLTSARDDRAPRKKWAQHPKVLKIDPPRAPSARDTVRLDMVSRPATRPVAVDPQPVRRSKAQPRIQRCAAVRTHLASLCSALASLLYCLPKRRLGTLGTPWHLARLGTWHVCHGCCEPSYVRGVRVGPPLVPACCVPSWWMIGLVPWHLARLGTWHAFALGT